MKILKQSKIDKAAKESRGWFMSTTSQMIEKSFKDGAEYAEKELIKVITDFAEWVAESGYIQHGISDQWRNVIDSRIDEYKIFTTKELLDKYLEENES